MNESPNHQGSLLFITPHWKSNDKLSEQKEWPSVSCLSGKGYRKDGNCLQLGLFKDILTLKILYCLFLMAFSPLCPSGHRSSPAENAAAQWERSTGTAVNPRGIGCGDEPRLGTLILSARKPARTLEHASERLEGGQGQGKT